MTDAPYPYKSLDLVEQSRVFGYDSVNNQYVQIASTADGQIQVAVYDSNGNRVSPATEPTLSTIAGAAASNATDHLLVQENTPLDVSGAEVDVDINSQTLGTVASDIERFGGAVQSAVDVADRIRQLTQALASTGATNQDSLLVDSNTALDVSAATVPTEQQTPVGIEDTQGNQVDPVPDSVVDGRGEERVRTEQRKNTASRFRHDDGHIRSGNQWYVPTNESWRARNVVSDGTLAVDGTVYYTGTISGSGKITGDGTIKAVDY